MSATVTVDREALRRLLYEVEAIGDVEALRTGSTDAPFMHWIFGVTEEFRRSVDPREGFDENRSDEGAQNAREDVRELHARHLFRTLVIEELMNRA